MVSQCVGVLVPGFRLFGQERALIDVGLTLRSAGHRVVFLIHKSWGHEIAGELTRLAFDWETLPLGTIWSPRLLACNPKHAFGNVVAISRTSSRMTELLQRLGMNCVIAGNISFAYYLMRSLRDSDVRLIFRHGDKPLSSTPFARHLSRTVFSRVDTHVANCRFLAETLTAFDMRLSARVIYNFPVARHAPEESQRAAPGPARHRLVYVGQLSPHKGLDLLLEAFDRLATDYPELTLDIVGGPPGIGKLEDAATPRKLNAFTANWHGRVRQFGQLADPTEVFRRATIHLCPSVWDDPSPNTIFEAKSYGLPTVAFPRGGIPELISHERDGFLCSPESPEGLMRGIRYFLDEPQRLTSARAAAARSLSERFGYDRYREAWLAVVQQPVARMDKQAKV